VGLQHEPVQQAALLWQMLPTGLQPSALPHGPATGPQTTSVNVVSPCRTHLAGSVRANESSQLQTGTH